MSEADQECVHRVAYAIARHTAEQMLVKSPELGFCPDEFAGINWRSYEDLAKAAIAAVHNREGKS